MNAKEREKQEFIKKLQEVLKPGDKVYTILNHVSRSGMMRVISVYAIKNNQPQWLSYWVAKAVGNTFDDKRDGVKVSGCGMDMGFALVYELSQTLFPGGFECIGESCPSNDHVNGDRNYKPHHHRSCGYALKQVWM